jgi:predicted O-methyltransferase YrrM
MVNIDNALQISGWMLPEELEWLAIQAQNKKRILELGSWKGRSTRAMLDNTTATITCVDTWGGPSDIWNYGRDFSEVTEHGPEFVLEQFINNTSRSDKIIVLKMSCDTAAKVLVGKFDMIFVDADHLYEAVKQDILNYIPLLTDDGLLCGHDYSPAWPGVVRAVHETLENVSVGAGTIWYRS